VAVLGALLEGLVKGAEGRLGTIRRVSLAPSASRPEAERMKGFHSG
jgi:hypothetical protein